MPACGRREALRLLISGRKQTHDFLEPLEGEEGLCQGIHGRPNLRVVRQHGRHARRQGLKVEQAGLWREDLQPGELVRGILECNVSDEPPQDEIGCQFPSTSTGVL
jgi:hypothetical protein